jgi:hypothetical protein
MFMPGIQASRKEAADGQKSVTQVGGSGFNKSRIGRVWTEDDFFDRGLAARLDNSLVTLGGAVE